MKLLFYTPFDMLRDLDEAFPLGSTPTEEEIDDVLSALDCSGWTLENVRENITQGELIAFIDLAKNYESYGFIDELDPYYKYFTQ